MNSYKEWASQIEEVQKTDHELHEKWLEIRSRTIEIAIRRTGFFIPILLWTILFFLERMKFFPKSWELFNFLLMSSIMFFPLLFTGWLAEKIKETDCGLDSPLNPVYERIRKPMIDAEVALGISLVVVDELIEKNILVANNRNKALIASDLLFTTKIDQVIIEDHLYTGPKENGLAKSVYRAEYPVEQRFWINCVTAETFVTVAKNIRKLLFEEQKTGGE